MITETELLYLEDAYLQDFEATVVATEQDRVALDRSAFYPTGGGQAHDVGYLVDGATRFEVTDVRKEGSVVWHVLGGGGPAPSTGTRLFGHLDWTRRHALMRTHTALHILCGVIWNEWGVPVTGGNMEPLVARMDFEFDPLPEGFKERVTTLVNDEIAADRKIEVSFLSGQSALADADLVRTKVNLVPEGVTQVRVVDIVGLDKQADGGTHVASTGEVGRFEVTKAESKGKANKRLRIAVHDN